MSRIITLLRIGKPVSTWVSRTTGAIAAIVFVCGLWSHNSSLLGVGAVVLVTFLWASWCDMTNEFDRSSSRSEIRRPKTRHSPEPANAAIERTQLPTLRAADQAELVEPPKNTEALVSEMLSTGRYALLLRPQMNRHLDREHIVRAVRHLDEAMALVPAGRVLLGPLAEQASSSSGAVEAEPKMLERFMLRVEALYLDRHTVTNAEFQQFINADGYETLEYWDEEALPALLDFVDETGHPGPRYWNEGHFLAGEDRHPVVGVSWYEASAFARWVGKRLPTDAEWTKAGAWPVESAPGRIAQRRYPWGESFDIRRANLWGSHRRGPVDVDEYDEGESVGGVHQLVGNVWEWSDSPLFATIDPSLHVPETYKSIRGGSFDTYFENQATCHYQSGEHPLARRHNIGFRLALPMSTLEVVDDVDAQDDDAEQSTDVTHAVTAYAECI
jgi:iron(II)-dependent oxidoreductase